MDIQELRNLLRRAEFNKTEPETLRSLVELAQRKTHDVMTENRRLTKNAKEIEEELDRLSLFPNLAAINNFDDLRTCPYLGTDGSFFPVEGVGGKWFVPLSAALVKFPEGMDSNPKVSISADIVVLKEEITPKIRTIASRHMLYLETKGMIKGTENEKPGILFIDGPIADPPSYIEEDYIRYRTDALKTVLRRKFQVMGCAKRVRDKFALNILKEKLPEDISVKLRSFPTDQYLFTYVFTQHRTRLGLDGPLTSQIYDTSDGDIAHRKYKELGVNTFAFFYQSAHNVPVIRVDIPTLNNNRDESIQSFDRALKALELASMPGFAIPLPIVLAHEKCNVRQGLAETLYDNMVARIREDEFSNQIAFDLMR